MKSHGVVWAATLAGALLLPRVGLIGSAGSSGPDPACCYFSAMNQDVAQPGQKAFLTFDPVEKVMSFTVQPQFAGNARDFGMVVPTPARPRLQEVHRDFFKSLAVFTILKPLDPRKFKPMALGGAWGPVRRGAGPADGSAVETKRLVTVLESGVVGSLDYKVLEAKDAGALFEWLRAHGYHYAGDQETLQHYLRKGWYFTVMKIDPQQMRQAKDGSYTGEVTPTRFTFESERLVYPLRITQISVKDRTEALFYILAPQKMDLPARFSYQPSYQTLWQTAFQWANWDLCTERERAWWKVVGGQAEEIRKLQEAQQRALGGVRLPSLEYARRLTDADLAVLRGEGKFDRAAPPEEVARLAILRGFLPEGGFLTKCRVTFSKAVMTEDLDFRPATFLDQVDEVEHIELLPTPPP